MSVKEMASLEYNAIDRLLSSMVKDMKGIIQSRKMSASGQAESMIEYEVKEGGTVIGILKGPDYIEFMERGRGPGKFPPLGAIEQWIEAKGIRAEGITNKQLAFLIGRKMAMEGSKLHRSGERSGILSKVITPERISTFVNDYTSEKIISVRDNLKPLIKI